ncbi:hypothetical protein CCYA_CCYA08G2350 [Cyanidiococcus yangmingshanensis]|nr:hypothetical protein CCYA_CCYA08G2350 [Cyanidiococcus yangmingshanensis]
MPDISTYNFYGPGFAPPNSEQVLRQVRNPESGDPRVLFRHFEFQSAALEFAAERDRALRLAGVSEPLFVFARELDASGRRDYFVGSIHSFLRKSWRFAPRCFSEVLREGFACKLYFDLEQALDTSWTECLRRERLAQLDVAVVSLVAAVQEVVRESSRGEVAKSFLDVLELDSTIPTKYSRHLIFPSVLLRDNIAVGSFVRNRVLPRVADSLPQNFVDLSVYSRNRCFRLPYSVKFGREKALEPTKRWRGSALLCMPVELQRSQTLQDAMLTNASYALACSLEMNVAGLERSARAWPLDQRRPSPEKPLGTADRRFGQSPYPELEHYIVEYALSRDESVTPRIRNWMFFAASRTILYAMTDHRYCARIQRQHRSNNVVYVVDLNQGLLFQKCLDPDCANWRSAPHSLPRDLPTWGPDPGNSDGSSPERSLRSVVPEPMVDAVGNDSLEDPVLYDLLTTFEREHAKDSLDEALSLNDEVLLDVVCVSEMSQDLGSIRVDGREVA